MKAATTFLLGFVLGATTVALAKRLKTVLDVEDADRLTSRLNDQLATLEQRTQAAARVATP